MKFIVGPACRFTLWCILLGNKSNAPTGDKCNPHDAYWQQKRTKTVRTVRRLFPDKVVNAAAPIEDGKGLIVGFNHPSLHEVLSLIVWSLEQFPDRRNNFPTNLPWYESLCRRANDLRNIGVCITPLITQSTFNKLVRIHEGNEKARDAISKVSEALLSHYFSVAIDFERTGDNTFSAPSAGRLTTIFPDSATFYGQPGAVKLLPAMSSLMFRIERANRAKRANVVFLPVTIVPPGFRAKWVNGLKLFRRYTIIVGEGFSMEEARELGRGIDHAFLKRLTENAPVEMWYPNASASNKENPQPSGRGQ